MASHLGPLPITSHKQDPAWKHVQMFKHGDRVQLKCIYCGKLFKGGGIHRIKEHLAKQKGNAAMCVCVPPHVRDLMQQNLNGGVTKRRKKETILDYVKKVNPVCNEVSQLDNACDAGIPLIGALDMNPLELSSNLLLNGEGTFSAIADWNNHGEERSVPDNADALALNTSGLGGKQVNNHLHMAIGRFLYDIGAPMDAVNSAYFSPMVDAIVFGGLESVMPSKSDIQGWILKNSVEEVKAEIDKISSGWGKTGCSLLVNQQKTDTKLLLNFLVNCPGGTVFFKSVDASCLQIPSDTLNELLKQVVEEVGASDVLQVIADNEELCNVAARRLADTFPNLYWTPCASSCLDMILKDFAKLDWITETIEKAKSITRFLYNHSSALNMVRRYTFGVDLLDPAVTPSASNFTTLKRMVDLKHNLQSMVTSQEWLGCQYSKTPAGQKILDTVNNQSFWSSCILITRLTNPLLRVLRIVDSKKRPAMGYVCAGMYRAKETIKREFVEKEAYMIYWNIIDRCWRQNLLYAAGFYLNPKFFYSFDGDLPNEIQSGMFDCVERLVPDTMVQDKIVKEMNIYKHAVGDLGRKMAIRARETLLAVEWWSTYGGSCPNLARLAIRILSQSCSSRGFNLSHIPLGQVHGVKNYLQHQRLRDLIFVQYNRRLKHLSSEDKNQDPMDSTSIDAANVVEDWVRQNDGCLLDYRSSNWTILHPTVPNTMVSGSPVDDINELGTGFNDFEVFRTVNTEE